MEIKFVLISYLSQLLWHITQSISYSQFPLTLINTRYALQLQVGSNKTPLDLIIDTDLPTSLINSVNCQLCQNSNTKNYDPPKSGMINEFASYKRRKYQYNGTEFKDSFFITDKKDGRLFSGTFPFLSIINISLTNSIGESGFVSLNPFSDFFNIINEKKIIILELEDSKGLMKIGDVDPETVDLTKLTYYQITSDSKQKTSYLLSKELVIKGEYSLPYTFTEELKLMIDTTTWQFHIPRDFFYKHIEQIIPLQCQITLNGFFYCECKPTDLDSFPTYNFTIGDKIISITPEHYLSYDSSNHICTLSININYYNEFWTIGLSLLTKKVTLFDYDNSQHRMGFITKTIPKKNDTTTFIIVFVSVALFSCLLFFGGYCLYKKYYLHANDNEANIPINQEQ